MAKRAFWHSYRAALYFALVYALLLSSQNASAGDSQLEAAQNAAKAAETTAEQQKELTAGMYYVNVHTKNHPGGAIRGQLESSK